MPSNQVTSALNILRRTPIQDIEQNRDALVVLLSPNDDAIDELYQRVDCPLQDEADPKEPTKRYLLSDFNRDGDSYRSPWSNEYHPPLSEERSSTPFTPSADLRSLEVHANQVWDVYRKLYYGTEAVSSVYLWDQEKPTTARGGGFAGTFLIQKQLRDQPIIGNQSKLSGYWNSIHVMDVTPMSIGSSKFKYKLTTTILLSLKINQSSQLTLGGSLTKQIETTESIQSSITDHMRNIGPMLERVETEMRSNMDALYLQKTKDVVTYLRSTGLEREREGLMAALMKQNSIGSTVVRQEEGMKDVMKARLSKMNESS